MAKMEGLEKLLANLRSRAAKAQEDARRNVSVGYSAPYALRVHEDLEMHHTNGQAKYLETPMRTGQAQMAEIVRRAMQQGKTLVEAETLAAEWLLEQARGLVPVDTGELRDSGYVKVE